MQDLKYNEKKISLKIYGKSDSFKNARGMNSQIKITTANKNDNSK